MPLEALLNHVLPWAKEHHPKAFHETASLALQRIRPAERAEHEQKVRRYCARIIDLRCEADADWRRTAPLGLLMESGQAFRMRERNGQGRMFVVKGRFAPAPHVITFDMLAFERSWFTALLDAQEILDLEAVLDA